MRSGQIYRNKHDPQVLVQIVWIAGDECGFWPYDEYTETEFMAMQLWNESCTIKEFLELYTNTEWENYE